MRATCCETLVPLFGLAPGGVYPATAVASSAVRSYRTFSPLPPAASRWRCLFCGTFRRLAPPRRYLAPCPMEPGLSSASSKNPQRLPSQLPEASLVVLVSSANPKMACQLVICSAHQSPIARARHRQSAAPKTNVLKLPAQARWH